MPRPLKVGCGEREARDVGLRSGGKQRRVRIEASATGHELGAMDAGDIEVRLRGRFGIIRLIVDADGNFNSAVTDVTRVPGT